MAIVNGCGGQPRTSCDERANEAGQRSSAASAWWLRAVLASMTRVVPDLITTVAGIAGVAGIIYGVSTGVLVVLNREPDE